MADTLSQMRAEWTGDPQDLVGMVGALAARVADEEDMINKARVSGPVQAHLRAHGPATVQEITAGVGLDEEDEEGLLAVALAVDMHRDLGLLVAHGNHRWGYPHQGVQPQEPASAAAVFGLPGDDIGRAQQLTERVRAVFADRPDEDLAMIDVGGAADIPPADAVALGTCLDILEDQGLIRQSGDRHGAGPTWRKV
ncbi:hypothetical protein [Nocardiopsis synnemataformans]|uniref:hypothetical protein n=1 Tax=Nocardiopsis synnemataformans TaxID=61305 RepID=UPI003EBB2EC2